MASPSPTRKNSVDLAAPVTRVSRIRRDPPPPVKEVSAAELKEREARNIVIGVVTVALALFAILFGFSAARWSPSQHTIHIQYND